MIQKINDLTPYYKVDRYVIPNTDDAYRIGTNGTVQSRYKQIGWKWIIGGDWRLLSPGLDTNGYPVVSLKINGTWQTKKIARLVCEAVHGPCPPFMEVCHVYDPNPLNNWSWNLNWGTHEDNMAHKRVHGNTPDQRGEKHPNAILSLEKVQGIRDDWKTGLYTQGELGKMYGTCRNNIWAIVNNKAWVEP